MAPGTPTVRIAATSALLTLVATVFAGLTLSFKHDGDHALEIQTELQQVATSLHVISGWEWRAISGAVAPDAARTRIEVTDSRLGRAVDDIAAKGQPTADVTRLRAGIDRYRQTVDQELGLLATERLDAALRVDHEKVAPAFTEAMAIAEELDHGAQANAREHQQLTDIMVIIATVGTVASSAVVLWWRTHNDAHRRAQDRVGAHYRALVDQSSDLVMVVDATGRLTYLSPSAQRFLDDLDDPTMISAADLVHPDDRGAFGQALDDASAESAPIAARLGSSSGWFHFEVSIRDLGDDPVIAGRVVTAHDVSERHALQQELRRQALHDSLTGLPNRALLGQNLHEALTAADPGNVGLLLVDLDRFKEINDTLGHHVGDLLLTQVGPRIQGLVGTRDTVARLGGDEFAVLVRRVDSLKALRELAETVRAALCEAFTVESTDLQVEASVGLVLSSLHGDDSTTLFKCADVAMYTAKTRGIGVFSYDPDQDTHHPDRIRLLGDLRQALKRGELVLHYQPQVNLGTRTVRGAEALVHWHHPERGLLRPDDFIPLAERTGLILPLTEEVLDLAIAQAARWRAAGRPIPVSVNLSSRNLLDTHLDERVAALLARYDLPADHLVLEISESAIMSEPERAAVVLNSLHRKGIRISIDDFGAGYTSLGQLKHLPLHELKVDRSFVTTMMQDRSNHLVVRSVMDLGHSLGLTTVAEGVETADAFTELTGFGCDIVQGYHLSRPLPAAEFDAWRAATALDDLFTAPTVPRPRSAEPLGGPSTL